MALVAKLRAGEVIYCGWSHLADAFVVETIATLGFDAVLLDMQHGGHDTASILAGMTLISGAGAAPFVRIPLGRNDMASRALDFGAACVVAPMINSRADAEAFAGAMKFPPTGSRSWGPLRARALQKDFDNNRYLANANSETLALAMVETREALSVLDDILSVDGIDGVFLGPGDFSISWTNGGSMNPTLEDMMPAVAEIGGKAKAAGKIAGMFVGDPGMCGRFREMGYSLFATGSEQRYMMDGATNILTAMREAVG